MKIYTVEGGYIYRKLFYFFINKTSTQTEHNNQQLKVQNSITIVERNHRYTYLHDLYLITLDYR